MLAHALSDGDGELCVCDLAWVAERQQNLVHTTCRCFAGPAW